MRGVLYDKSAARDSWTGPVLRGRVESNHNDGLLNQSYLPTFPYCVSA